MYANLTMRKSVSHVANALLAAVVTTLLLLLMCTLIATDDVVLESGGKKVLTQIYMDKTTIVPQPTDPKPEPVDPPTPQPKVPPQVARTDFNPEYVTPTPVPVVDGPHLNAGVSSGTAMAMMTVAPDYPMSARRRGVEGYVDLMFDVTATGRTDNIRVIQAQPEGYFERASIRTLAKWKYQPALREGVPVAQYNQTTRIRFALEK